MAANWKVVDRELPGVLPLLDDPPRAVQGEPARQRREHRARRQLGRRLDGPPRRAPQTMSLDGRSGGRRDGPARRAREAHRHVRRGAAQPADQPAPRLRDDPPADPALARPHPDPLLVGVPGRGRRRGRLRPGVRRGLLGHHQPAGLGGLRVGAAGHARRRASSRVRWRRTRTASTTSSPTWPAPTRGRLRRRPERWQGVPMAYYRSVGDVPPKRHTQHRDPDGQPLPRGADGRGGLLLGLLAALPPRRAVGDRRQPGVGAARPDPHAQPPAQAAPPQAARRCSRATATGTRSPAAGSCSATTTSGSATS